MYEKDTKYLSFLGIEKRLDHFMQQKTGDMKNLGKIEISDFFNKLLAFNEVLDEEYRGKDRYPETLLLIDEELNILEFTKRSENRYTIRFYYKMRNLDTFADFEDEEKLEKCIAMFYKQETEKLLNYMKKQ